MRFDYDSQTETVTGYEGKYAVVFLDIPESVLTVEDDRDWTEQEKDEAYELMIKEYNEFKEEQGYDVRTEQWY